MNNSVPPPYDVARRIYSNPAASEGGAGGVYYNEPPERAGCCSTLGRIPCLTLLGVLLVGAGSAFLMLGYKTFAGPLYDTYEALGFSQVMEKEWSEDFADFIDKEAKKGKDSYYSPENPQYIIVDSCLAGAGCMFLMIVAIISTGLTRRHCCEARSCCQGYCIFVHFSAGIVVMLFLLTFFCLSLILFIPLLLSKFLNEKCPTGSDAIPNNRPCFNSIELGFTLPSDTTTYNGTEICFGDVNFCSRIDDLQTGFIYWCAGGFGAILGMILVLMSQAANVAHFSDMRRGESEEKYVF
ncbi:uncharacterized protein LOC142344832 [Convolutriloba macropyga]|uniref:uncharacterized protein LOC142344832 n=1 Tax=Convolutriloba macropyga TaxID=536237 RepID=UPI003F52647F